MMHDDTRNARPALESLRRCTCGMPHVFESNVGRLAASGEARDLMGDFLTVHFAAP